MESWDNKRRRISIHKKVHNSKNKLHFWAQIWVEWTKRILKKIIEWIIGSIWKVLCHKYLDIWLWTGFLFWESFKINYELLNNNMFEWPPISFCLQKFVIYFVSRLKNLLKKGTISFDKLFEKVTTCNCNQKDTKIS